MIRLIGQMALAAALAGCALNPASLRPGQSEAQVRAALGEPTGRYQLPSGGERLEYALGPYGRATWMVDLDEHGQVSRWAQVLQDSYFAQIRDGMSREELLLLLGRPADRAPEWQNRETWSWRFETYECEWLRVTLSAEQRVVGGGSIMIDPMCDKLDRE
ncbi:MAG: hypothetical protein K0B16_09900 [Burkholderiaceae bacterium]|nr:hypothetical protein [Burkholderiaceae bacterium]